MLYSSFRKRIKFRLPLLTSSLKSKIRQFLFVVGQKRQRNVQNSEMQVQSCCLPMTPFVVFYVLAVAFASSSRKVPNASASRSLLNSFIVALWNIAFSFSGLIVT